MPTEHDQQADTMKIGAESANPRQRVSGLDGRGWVEQIEKLPMVTLPPGAGALVVAYFRSQQQQVLTAAASHLRSARSSADQLPPIAGINPHFVTIANGIEAAMNLLGMPR